MDTQNMLKLLLTNNNAVIHEYPLKDGINHIGRSANNEIRLADMSVSAKHAEITVTPNQYLSFIKDILLVDLQSTNGTLKNGNKIKKCRLSHGDQFQIGSLSFTLEYDQQGDTESTRIYLPDTQL